MAAIFRGNVKPIDATVHTASVAKRFRCLRRRPIVSSFGAGLSMSRVSCCPKRMCLVHPLGDIGLAPVILTDRRIRVPGVVPCMGGGYLFDHRTGTATELMLYA